MGNALEGIEMGKRQKQEYPVTERSERMKANVAFGLGVAATLCAAIWLMKPPVSEAVLNWSYGIAYVASLLGVFTALWCKHPFAPNYKTYGLALSVIGFAGVLFV